MTFLAPWVLAAAGAAALAAVVLHLIALARPPAAVLPTARFIPDASARAASLTRRPTDRWLLLLRVLALLLLGAAFARPVRTPPREPMRTLLLVDRADSVTWPAVRDSALARLAAGDAVIAFDTAAVLVAAPDVDSLRATLGGMEAGAAPSRLSAALVAASRLATTLRDSTDSLHLVVVSPLARESLDAATGTIREQWPAAIELVQVGAATPSLEYSRVDVGADDDDPLAAAVALRGGLAAVPARVVRNAPIGADSAWVRESGGVLLVWPDAAPQGWVPRPSPDTVGAVVADGQGGVTLVAPLMRVADAPDGLAVRARWVDGTAAAVEYPLGAGCVRTVGIPLAGTGDLALRASFGRFLAAMLEPCGARRDRTPLTDSALAQLRGAGPTALALGAPRSRGASLAAWPLGLGLLLLLGELAVRRRSIVREAA